MRFYIDKPSVIRWNPKGWPEVPPVKASIYADMASMNRYDRELSRAKAESVPVAGQMEIKSLIRRAHKIDLGKTVPPGLYDVPDSEINKEWL